MIELISHNEQNPSPALHWTETEDAQYGELEGRVHTVLQRYSNIHRGSGHYSKVTTALYEQARKVVLEYFGLSGSEYTVVFGSKWSLEEFKRSLKKSDVNHQIFSNDIGLPLGTGALAVRKNAGYKKLILPKGGGTARLVSRNVVIWGGIPAIGEAGTPNIIGAIALAVALQMIKDAGGGSLFNHKTAVGPAETLLHDDDFQGMIGTELMSKLRSTLIGGGLPVPTSAGWMPHTNLDNAASTLTFEVIWDVVRSTLRLQNQYLEEIIEEVKDICARFFNAPRIRYDILFTQNTTEGINGVAELMRRSAVRERGSHHLVLNTLLEHNSNELPWRSIPGVSVLRMDVDTDGFLDLSRLEEILYKYNRRRSQAKKRIGLVAISGCSNVLGTLNDVEGIGKLAHRFGAQFLVDAAQLAAHRSIDVQSANIDYLVFSGHKMYAPFGCGGLIIRKGLFDLGGSLIDEIETSGNANAVGIAAMGKAMKLLGRIGLDVVADREDQLTRCALEGLRRISDVQVFGHSNSVFKNALPTGPIVSFSMKKTHHNLVAKMLAEKGGISVRDGCLCAHLLVKHLIGVRIIQRFLSNISMLLFPKTTKKFLPGIVRMSFGLASTKEDIDHTIRILTEIANERQPIINRIFARFHYGSPALPKTAEEGRIEEYISEVVKHVFTFSHKKPR